MEEGEGLGTYRQCNRPSPARRLRRRGSARLTCIYSYCAQPASHTPTRPRSRRHDSITSCSMFIVDTVLSFVKAYHLKGDTNSLKTKISERFSGASVCAAKKVLWESCADALRALNLPYQQRRDSDKRRQLTADVEDIIMAFDALDSNDSIPPIYCEASDLYKLPPISLDPLAEQVESNCQVLKDLKSVVERLESKFSSFSVMSSTTTSRDHSSEQQDGSNSYASMVNSFTPPAATTSCSPSTAATKPLQSTERGTNLVLFGLSETHSLIESKEIVDDLLQFLAGKPVQIRDMFRLGKINHSSTAQSRPRPILIKLSMAWDRKLVLLRKRNLKEFRIKHLFVREDLPPELRQQNHSKVRLEKKTGGSLGEKLHVSTSASSALAQSQQEQTSGSMVDIAQKFCTASLRSRCNSSQSISSTHTVLEDGSPSPPLSPSPHSSRSVSPSSSSSTLVQEPPGSY